MRRTCGRRLINDIGWFAHFPEVNASTSLNLQSELLGVELLPNFSPFRSPKLIQKIKIVAQILWFMRWWFAYGSEVFLGEHPIFLKIEDSLFLLW